RIESTLPTDVFSSGASTFAHVSKLGVLDHALTNIAPE
ncbi:hypothetical protein J2797_005443, partial [Paraburkholderia terricola]|nr:hypothetical protein [Paraburkholderia terricola]